MNIKQTEKYIRDGVRNYGLVFRKSKITDFYVFADRKSKEVIMSNCTLGTALCNYESGYLSSYDVETETFKGIDENGQINR